MTKEEKRIRKNAFNNARQKKYYQSEKGKAAIVEYRESDKYKDIHKASTKKMRESEGVGVYRAVYLSGVYIGSGLIYGRKVNHLNGHSSIAKKLKQKAISFEVLHLCETKEDAKTLEQATIELYGIENLLNKNNAVNGKYNSGQIKHK